MAQTQKTLNTIIVLRHGTKDAWEADNSYCLQEGEVGVGYMAVEKTIDGEKTTVQVPIIKIGDANGTAWKDLPQAEGVFEEDLTLTYNFGKHKTSNGSVNAGGKGMTTSEWLLDALSEVLTPKTNYPTAALKANGYTTDTGSNEIGSKITAIKWQTETGSGSYVGNDGTGTYGSSGKNTSDTGITASNFTWSISNETSTDTSSATSGTFAFTSDKYIQIDDTDAKTYTYLNGSVTLDASGAYTPKNNLGKLYEAGKITGFDKNGTTSKTFEDVAISATGFRNTWQYVGTDHTSTLNSDFFRTAKTGLTAKNSNTTSFGTVTIPAGTTRVAFAVLGSKTLKSVIDVDGQGLDVKANFDTDTVAIKGANNFEAANYTVFHFENAKGIAATKYTVTIG